jgi:hypothetical protein
MPSARIAVITGFFLLLLFGEVYYRCRLQQQGRNIIDGDGKGYYEYLVQWSNYGNLLWARPEWNSRASLPHYISEYEQRRYNKYTPGTAVCMAPAFLAARMWQKLTSHPRNLFGKSFQYALLLNGVFFLCLGLWFVVSLLKLTGISSETALIANGALTFSSNLIFYAVHEPAMSHVYSFTCIAGWAYGGLAFLHHRKSKHLFLALFMFFMAIAIRPFHLLLLFALPWFMYQAKSTRRHFPIPFSPLFVLAFLPLLLVLILNYLQAGTIWPPQYPEEGFYFSHPQLVELMIGFRKGLFTWFPLTLLAVVGWTHKQHRWLFLWFFITLYFLSSWWNWYYGDSFGLRPVCDYLAFFMVGFVALFHQVQAHRILRIPLFLAMIFFLAWNTLLNFQYLNGILPPDGMTAEKAKFVAGKVSLQYAGLVKGEPQEIYGYPLPPVFADSKDSLISFSADKEYGPVMDFTVAENITNGNRYLASLICEYKEGTASEALLTLTIFGKNEQVLFWDNGCVTPLPRIKNQWYPASYNCILPREISAGSKIRFVIWNKGKQKFLCRKMAAVIQPYALSK